eukprot:1003282-Prymnesium_polylepis.1
MLQHLLILHSTRRCAPETLHSCKPTENAPSAVLINVHLLKNATFYMQVATSQQHDRKLPRCLRQASPSPNAP